MLVIRMCNEFEDLWGDVALGLAGGGGLAEGVGGVRRQGGLWTLPDQVRLDLP